jgi:hypothetical protein
MSFGWIIALPSGRRLARCSGPAFGSYGSSFQADGYGFLSVTQFLIRLCEFCAVSPSWTIQMMTDNLGLVTPRIVSNEFRARLELGLNTRKLVRPQDLGETTGRKTRTRY